MATSGACQNRYHDKEWTSDAHPCESNEGKNMGSGEWLGGQKELSTSDHMTDIK